MESVLYFFCFLLNIKLQFINQIEYIEIRTSLALFPGALGADTGKQNLNFKKW